MSDIALELKRRKGEMSQQEFAEYLGISQAHLSDILSGKQVPGLSPAARAILSRFPDMLAFFVPANIDKFIGCQHIDKGDAA